MSNMKHSAKKIASGNDEDGLAYKEMYKVENGVVDAELPKFIRDQIK